MAEKHEQIHVISPLFRTGTAAERRTNQDQGLRALAAECGGFTGMAMALRGAEGR